MTDQSGSTLAHDGVALFSTHVPPQAMDVEAAVLGAMMMDNAVISAVASVLQPEDFYKPAHHRVYRVMLDMHRRGQPIDLATIKHELEAIGLLDKIGGPVFLIDLSDSVLTAANAEAHARLIKDKAVLRATLQLAYLIQQRVYDQPGAAAELLSEVDGQLRQLRQQAQIVKNGQDVYVGPLQMAARFEALQKLRKVPTGLATLDGLLEEGFAPDTFSVIAGRTSEGKTAFRQNVMVNLLVAGYGVCCFATEPTLRTESKRLVSIRTGIAYDVLKDVEEWKSTDVDRYALVRTALEEIDLWHRHHVFDRRLSVAEIEEWIKRIKDGGRPLHVAFIDRFDFITDVLAVTDSSRKSATIKAVAQQLLAVGQREAVHFSGLVQITRASGTQKARLKEYSRPQLDQLAESRAFEDTAELVLFVHRPGKYDDKLPDNRMEVGVAKQREGPAGAGCYVTLGWDGPTRRVFDLDANERRDFAV